MCVCVYICERERKNKAIHPFCNFTLLLCEIRKRQCAQCATFHESSVLFMLDRALVLLKIIKPLPLLESCFVRCTGNWQIGRKSAKGKTIKNNILPPNLEGWAQQHLLWADRQKEAQWSSPVTKRGDDVLSGTAVTKRVSKLGHLLWSKCAWVCAHVCVQVLLIWKIKQAIILLRPGF